MRVQRMTLIGVAGFVDVAAPAVPPRIVGVGSSASGLRADYGPKYYASFLVDPDGNNVEAVCLS